MLSSWFLYIHLLNKEKKCLTLKKAKFDRKSQYMSWISFQDLADFYFYDMIFLLDKL